MWLQIKYCMCSQFKTFPLKVETAVRISVMPFRSGITSPASLSSRLLIFTNKDGGVQAGLLITLLLSHSWVFI